MKTFIQAFAHKYPSEQYILKHITMYNDRNEPRWKDFSRTFILGLIEYLKEHVSQNSARTYCAHIRSVLNDYSEEVKIPCRDYKQLLSVRKIDSYHTYLTNAEISLLCAYQPEDEREHTVRNQFVLSCFTGMRHSDVIRLDFSNIVDDSIVYRAEKTSKMVKVPNSGIVKRLMTEQKNMIHHKIVFNNTIQNICKKVGIKDVVKIVWAGVERTGEKWQFIASHTARRSFATNLYLHTENLLAVSQMMGHSSVRTTQGYICCDFLDNATVLGYFNQFNS